MPPASVVLSEGVRNTVGIEGRFPDQEWQSWVRIVEIVLLLDEGEHGAANRLPPVASLEDCPVELMENESQDGRAGNHQQPAIRTVAGKGQVQSIEADRTGNREPDQLVHIGQSLRRLVGHLTFIFIFILQSATYYYIKCVMSTEIELC